MPAPPPRPSDAILDLLAKYAGPGPYVAEANAADRAVTDDWLTYFERTYARTRNPAYVWEAIGMALGNNRSVPPWTAQYLVRVANTMQTMSRTNIPADEIAPLVYRALEFVPARGVNPFRALTDAGHDLAIACEVLSEIRGGKKLDFALGDVARDHPARCTRSPRCVSLSRSAVSLIWKAHGPRINR